MADVERADRYEHLLSFAQVHKRIMNAVELQSTLVDALLLHNNFVR